MLHTHQRSYIHRRADVVRSLRQTAGTQGDVSNGNLLAVFGHLPNCVRHFLQTLEAEESQSCKFPVDRMCVVGRIDELDRDTNTTDLELERE